MILKARTLAEIMIDESASLSIQEKRDVAEHLLCQIEREQFLRFSSRASSPRRTRLVLLPWARVALTILFFLAVIFAGIYAFALIGTPLHTK